MKGLLAFVLGAAAGIGGTFLYLNEKYKREAEHDIREGKEYWEVFWKEYYSNSEAKTEETEEEPVKEEPKREKASNGSVNHAKPPITEYHNIAKKYDTKSDIHVISGETFDCSHDEGFEHTFITYHEGDETFEDEFGEQMTPAEIEGYFGLDIEPEKYFGEESESDDIVYFRNEKRKIDIELQKDLGCMGD